MGLQRAGALGQQIDAQASGKCWGQGTAVGLGGLRAHPPFSSYPGVQMWKPAPHTRVTRSASIFQTVAPLRSVLWAGSVPGVPTLHPVGAAAQAPWHWSETPHPPAPCKRSGPHPCRRGGSLPGPLLPPARCLPLGFTPDPRHGDCLRAHVMDSSVLRESETPEPSLQGPKYRSPLTTWLHRALTLGPTRLGPRSPSM